MEVWAVGSTAEGTAAPLAETACGEVGGRGGSRRQNGHVELPGMVAIYKGKSAAPDPQEGGATVCLHGHTMINIKAVFKPCGCCPGRLHSPLARSNGL